MRPGAGILLLLLLGAAAAAGQACSYTEVRPGAVVGIEGKTLIGWEVRGEPEVRIDSTIETGGIQVVVTRPEAPVYRADKVYFEKIVTTKQMALGSVFGRVMLAALFTAVAKNRRVDPWSRSHAAMAAVHVALVYDEREFIPVGSRIDPGKVLVEHDLVFVAERESESRGVPGARVTFVGPGAPGGVSRRTDDAGRAAFDLRAAARACPPGGMTVWIEVEFGTSLRWNREIRVTEPEVERLRREP
jgi:hypothetical protein